MQTARSPPDGEPTIFLLILTHEVEASDIGARLDFYAIDVEDVSDRRRFHGIRYGCLPAYRGFGRHKPVLPLSR